MQISISSVIFDPAGHLLAEIDPEQSGLDYLSRRVSRTATLDGGAYVVDNGYTASDATFTIVFKNLAPHDRATIERMVTLHSELIVVTNRGAFLGHIDEFREEPPTLRFLVKKQLNEV